MSNPFAHLNPRSTEYLDPDAADYEQRYAALREQWKSEATRGFAPSRTPATQQLPRQMPRPVQPERPAPQPVNNTALADAILRAGEKRRSELMAEPEAGSVAAFIIQAGKKRRGEI